LSGSTSLTSIEVADIFSLNVSNCTNLSSISVPNSFYAVDVNASGCTSLTTLNVSYANSIDLTGADNLQSATLQYYNGASIDLSFKNVLTTVNTENASTNLQSIDLSFCTLLTSVTLGNMTSVDNLNFDNCSSLTVIDLNYQFVGATSDFSVNGCTNLTTLNCYYNYMTGSVIDGILIDLDTNGASNGYVNLLAPTSVISYPSATGLTAKTNLEGRGWTVLVNSGGGVGWAFWTGASSLPSSYTYVGGTVTDNENDLFIDDITLLQTFSSPNSGGVGGGVDLTGATSLTSLEISNAVLFTIDLTGCTALTTLILNNHNFTSIAGLTSLSALQSFTATSNVLLDVGSQLTGLSNLQTVNVSGSLSSGSTLDLSGLTNLVTVNASFSYIGSLLLDNTGSTGGTVQVFANNISGLSNFSASNADIGSIDLSGSNGITTISAGTGVWYYASNVNLSNCNLSAANLNIIVGNLASVMTPTNSVGTLNIAGNTQDGTTAGYIATIQANGWTVIQ
jgi:hypothetical protein